MRCRVRCRGRVVRMIRARRLVGERGGGHGRARARRGSSGERNVRPWGGRRWPPRSQDFLFLLPMRQVGLLSAGARGAGRFILLRLRSLLCRDLDGYSAIQYMVPYRMLRAVVCRLEPELLGQLLNCRTMCF